ncbi:family 10 glycosylhydrolase [Bacteroides sp. BFG-638]|uniref:alpha amylase family protein n=1 Tax=Bacteroides TaxID=816 RepID=UPI0021652DCE|nr:MULTISPECIES: alpha amylase family protein [unclassified Bacteroides]MCS2949892.1 family 10 glycosylhydrolase [Bacteroides sp. BFG-638]MCS2951615.1 family 10 glycosylhydrolase [Bacteroides sp. BFG-638]MCS3313470.1 family 10 glycosylhydrolase [Bacteroides sp. BFG-637]
MKKSLIILLLGFILCSCSKDDTSSSWEWEEPELPVTPVKSKPRYIWIDAAANFPDFANSKENIIRDLNLAKDAGFTDIVVDVRPTTGDVLFKTNVADPVKYLYAWISGRYTQVQRTAEWDYLQVFIDEGHKLGLKVHAAINTMVGGNTTNNGTGVMYRDASKAEWATQMNTASGIVSVMHTNESIKFFNPVREEVQQYVCDILKDLAQYNIDGIILDRGRFLDLQSDFSDYTRKKFEEYIEKKINIYPNEILSAGTKVLPAAYPAYLTQWLEFRVKVMYDFMARARKTVKSVNSSIQFGVYVGGWYSSYYDVGVNWANPEYDPSTSYKWATKKYKNYGYAGLMDHMLIGAYASPLNVYGTTEWTMSGFCSLAKAKIKGTCPLVVGGPDVGNWDPDNRATQAQENQAIVNSVKACMDACDGYFLFDMIHLKLANQWQYAKEGINLAIN